jgi:hypothetical protein
MIDTSDIRPGIYLAIVTDPDSSRAAAIIGDPQENAMQTATQLQMEGAVFKVLAIERPLLAVEYLNGARAVISTDRFSFKEVSPEFVSSLTTNRQKREQPSLMEHMAISGMLSQLDQRITRLEQRKPWWRRIFSHA